eukprot:Hpha_TRINITY_DN16490_c7_g4::TRINITY_DN16490_c7_g4_i1::g.159951::m.159951
MKARDSAISSIVFGLRYGRRNTQTTKTERCFQRCSNWIMRDTDTPTETSLKRGFTPVAVVMFFITVYLVYSKATRKGEEFNAVDLAAMIIYNLAFTQYLVWGWLGR